MENNSTPIAQNNDSSMIDDMTNNDNSQIVNEILSEMNNTNQSSLEMNNDEQYMMDQNNQLERQMDNSVNMAAMDNIPMENTEESHIPEMEVTMESKEESILSKIFKMVKNPLIVIVSVLLVFSPVVKNLLVKYLPKIFTNQTTSTQYLGLLLQSIIVGIVFFSTDSLLR
uniref:Uncharacterized protein n=1 Tax=viral metagenome TaxID=1070528 RepID=A0A6C0M0M9_9ZZZZ